jgi:hypothetical protein
MTHSKRILIGPSRLPAVLISAAILSANLAAQRARATDYQWNPRVEVGGLYNDNYNLSNVSANKLGIGGGMVDAQLEFRADQPRTLFRVTPEVQATYFPSHSDQNSNNEAVRMFFQQQGLTYNAGINANWMSRELVNNGLPTTAIIGGLGQPGQTTTLITAEGFRQNLTQLDPFFNLQMTPRTRLVVNAGYIDSSFNKQQNDSYVGYHDTDGSAGVAYDVTPTGSLMVAGSVAGFRPGNGRGTNTYGIRAEWDGHLSQYQEYYIRLGGDRTSDERSAEARAADATTFGIGSIASKTNFVGGAGVHWTLQVTEIFLDVTRAVTPGGSGFVFMEDQLRLAATRRFTPKFAAFVAVRGIKDDVLQRTAAAVAQPTQKYVLARAGIEWRVLREFSLIGAYDRTSRNVLNASASSNQISVSFVYEPKRPAEGPAITVGY